MPGKRSPHPRPVAWLLRQLHSALRAATDKALAPLGLTASQAAVLSALGSDSRLSNADLARASFMTPQSMVEILRSLETQELIVRRPHPLGGRALPAELTPQGAKRLANIQLAMRRVEERLLRDFHPDESAQFRQMLERCLGVYEDFR